MTAKLLWCGCVWVCERPLKQHIDECVGAGEGSVGGEEDSGVVRFVTLRFHKLSDEVLQHGRLHPAHLQRAVLNTGHAHQV